MSNLGTVKFLSTYVQVGEGGVYVQGGGGGGGGGVKIMDVRKEGKKGI